MSSTRNPQQAKLTDFDLPESIQNLDPRRARTLVMNQDWSPTSFIREIENASAGDVAQYLSKHGLKEDANKNRVSPAGCTLAKELDDKDSIKDAVAAHNENQGGEDDG